MMTIFKKLLPSALLIAGFFVFGSGQAHAQFNAGRIIDDGVFTNKSAMSVQDIQNFLNARVPVCDTNHAPGSGSQGEQPPWTCLKNFSENGKSAAQIIWEAGQTYNINPQVILVTLQKENGLITDTWPYNWQYRTAMGMGCPDGAACDAQYFGFTNQVNQGTRHLAGFYNQNAGWYIPYRPGVSYIKWHPNAACGGTNVNIENRATASLYSYTPYQPNGAALANMYGTGDGCSSYGNRNFWRDFTSWFGTTYTPTYQWELTDQRIKDYISGADIDISTGVTAGDRVILYFKAKNTGSATWYNNGQNPIRVGTSKAFDRFSSFCDPSWIACHRPVNMVESSVTPGEVGTFQFAVQAPATPGTYNEYFNLLAEGSAWMRDIGLYYQIKVNPLDLKYTVISNTLPTQLATGATGSGTVTLRNDSNGSWYNGPKFPIRLGASSPPDRLSNFYDSSTWLGRTRLANQSEFRVAPGQQATFNITLRAPSTAGNYTEIFAPVADGIKWSNQTMSHNISVKSDLDASLDSSSTSNVVLGGTDTTTVTLKYLNTGLNTWTNSGPNPIRLGTDSPMDRKSGFCATSWIVCHRPTNLQEASVAPGQIGTFQFVLEGKPYFGSNPYYERFKPLKEGVKWFGQTSQILVNYTNQSYSWQLTDQYAYTDSNKTTPVNMASMSPSQTIFIGFKAKNTGTATWRNNGSSPIGVATSRPYDKQSVFCTINWVACHRPAYMKESTVAPGQTGTFEYEFKTPPSPGNYSEYFVPVIEGYKYLNDIGLYYVAKVQ